jgi:hypothetical protein
MCRRHGGLLESRHGGYGRTRRGAPRDRACGGRRLQVKHGRAHWAAVSPASRPRGPRRAPACAPGCRGAHSRRCSGRWTVNAATRSRRARPRACRLAAVVGSLRRVGVVLLGQTQSLIGAKRQPQHQRGDRNLDQREPDQYPNHHQTDGNTTNKPPQIVEPERYRVRIPTSRAPISAQPPPIQSRLAIAVSSPAPNQPPSARNWFT